MLDGRFAYPARVNGNQARVGAGIMVVDDGASFVGINGTIDGNTAQELGGGFHINEPNTSFSMYRAVDSACFNPQRCSSLANNAVSSAQGAGAAGFVAQDAQINIAQTHINDNRADSDIVMAIMADTFVKLEGNIIYDNGPFNQGVFPNALFRLNNGSAAEFDFTYNTVTNNINLFAFELTTTPLNKLNIFNSIIFNLGNILNQNNNTNNIIQADCSIMQETETLTGNIGLISSNNPNFIDPNNFNFRVQTSSVAIDMCDETLFDGAQHRDIDHRVRGYNNETSADLLGPFDAGAFEMTSDDLIFLSGFE